MLPKKKFAFGAKKSAEKSLTKEKVKKTKEEEQSPTKVTPSTDPKYSLSNLTDRRDLKLEGDDLNDQAVYLADLCRCTVILGSPSGSLMARRLTDCRVIAEGPIASSALLIDCTGCEFALACRQLRVHGTRDTRLDINVASDPIIEDCSGLSMAPLLGNVEATNHWSRVQDFSCPTTAVAAIPAAISGDTSREGPAANFTLLPDTEWREKS